MFYMLHIVDFIPLSVAVAVAIQINYYCLYEIQEIHCLSHGNISAWTAAVLKRKLFLNTVASVYHLLYLEQTSLRQSITTVITVF